MEDINVKLKQIIRDLINSAFQTINISDSTNLIYDLGFDSITIVNLILEIENTFDVEMDSYDLDIICEYGALCEMVEQILMSGD